MERDAATATRSRSPLRVYIKSPAWYLTLLSSLPRLLMSTDNIENYLEIVRSSCRALVEKSPVKVSVVCPKIAIVKLDLTWILTGLCGKR